VHSTKNFNVEPEVTLQMFNMFKDDITDSIKNHGDRISDNSQRIIDLEGQMKLLKEMAQPKGDDGKGLLDAMQEWIDGLRKELNDNIDNSEGRVSKRIDNIQIQMADFALKNDLDQLENDHN
jgi:hypothetical protein